MAQGASIQAYVDGALLLSVTDATYTSGRVGFYASVAGSVDDLVITDPQVVHYVRGAGGEVLAEYDGAGVLQAEDAFGNGACQQALSCCTGTDFTAALAT